MRLIYNSPTPLLLGYFFFDVDICGLRRQVSRSLYGLFFCRRVLWWTYIGDVPLTYPERCSCFLESGWLNFPGAVKSQWRRSTFFLMYGEARHSRYKTVWVGRNTSVHSPTHVLCSNRNVFHRLLLNVPDTGPKEPRCLPVPKLRPCSRKEGRRLIEQIIRSIILLLHLELPEHRSPKSRNWKMQSSKWGSWWE
jgi:hypothetical protein